ncbi:MAG: hypothetical protein JXN64_09430 [Spirochaetes bacterium]|nr:hypothetical protein [Spirochaetota bacterium]
MNEHKMMVGEGRTRITLSAKSLGSDLTVSIYNENAHIGAVAVGEYDHRESRVSTSVITRSGHKDNVIAQKAAYLISRKTKSPSCVIVGVHLDDITEEEIQEFLINADSLVEDFLMDWEHNHI